MKVLLLILLLAVCIDGEDFFKSKLGKKIKDIVDKIKTHLNVTALLKIREKFLHMRKQAKAELALSPEKREEFEKLAKNVALIQKNHVQKSGDSISEINENTGMGELLFQGDIVLTEPQADELVESFEHEGGNRTKRQAFKDRNYPRTLWADGVNYFFDPSATPSMRSVFVKATKEWSKNTCIDFRENRQAPNRIRLFKENGCWSYIGNLNRQQELSLGDGCDSIGTAAHELGHAIGFWHTHSRLDRDSFITFNPQNVKPSWLDQFRKETPETNDNYGITYDYGSIMHYGANSASGNGRPTMVAHDAKYTETLGSPFISFYEYLMINKHYECDKKCSGGSAQCKMGGFPNPRDCSSCVCPSGYGGKLCDERPSGCGEVLQAKKEPQLFEGEIGDKSKGGKPREDMMICNYWIQAPQGSKVQLTIKSLFKGVAVNGCSYWGVELKTHKDQRLTGYRFCSPEDAGVTLVSDSNIVPVITYNRIYATSYAIEYKIV
ncbi:hypothetical protein RB195_004479 [Necator americanus]|uniref:Zinc metalloproteinase n=1 Tax=Necator americanus TaxID=51031 RepID=A0ABR1BI98_NECAM